METGPINPLRSLRNMAILNIVLLTVQGWTGDAVNLFAAFPSGPMSGMEQFFSSLAAAGPGPLASWHAIEGIVVILTSVGIAVAAFTRTHSRNVRIVAILGLLFVLSAAYGGYAFVLSGFLDNGNSAQMGGSFIGSYAMNFMVLYYSK
jgi:hypothetical protein